MNLLCHPPVQPIVFLQFYPRNITGILTGKKSVNRMTDLSEHGRERCQIPSEAHIHRIYHRQVEMLRCHGEKISDIVIHCSTGIGIILQIKV